MKIKLSLIGFILIVVSIGIVFADVDNKNWFEQEFDELEYDVKKEYNNLLNDAAIKATETRQKIIKAADSLAISIETEKNAAERSKYIAALSASVVAATQDTKVFYMNMSEKAGNMTDKFTNMLYGHEKNDDMLRVSAKMFSQECDRFIFKLLDEADANTADITRIKAEYKSEIKAADIKLKNAYRKYSGFYLSGITSGADYEKAKQNFSDTVTSMVTLASNIYAKELGKLSAKEKARVIAERKKMIKTQSAMLQERIEKKQEKNKK